MARKKLLHLKSNVTQNVNGSIMPKLPTSEQIDYGEIAVNYAEGYETLAIKNSNGDVIPFTNSITMYDYIDDKLGSGFTSSSVTEVIEENEEIVSASLNDLNSRKLDASAYTESMTDYYTKSEVDERDLWVSGSGLNSVVLKGTSGVASGDYAVSEGLRTEATGKYSNAEGHYTVASGQYSHAEGSNTIASGESSHAEGYNTQANGDKSHAEGLGTKANGDWGSHAEGHDTKANGGSSHAEGSITQAIGDYSHSEGEYTTASGAYSHAEGYNTRASGSSSHAEGYNTKANGGYGSHAEGQNTIASGSSSHAEGLETTANGNYSHAEGYSTIANGNYSHAEGSTTMANGIYSHTEGYYTTGSSSSSHAEGERTQAIGDYSHSEGEYTTARGQSSHAEGRYTVANNVAEHASGQYNVSLRASTIFGNSGNTLFSVGNGANPNMRHNAFEIKQNGDIYIVDTDDTTSSNVFEKPMIRLQDAIDLSNYYTKSETSGATEISTALDNKLDVSAYTPVTVDQVIDSGTSASTNAVSTSAVYERFAENEETWALALNQLNNDKVGYAEYDSENQLIKFYKDEDESTAATPTVIASIDASAFVKDGFLSGVTLEDRTISGESKPCLVFEWNTDAGIQETVIPIGDAFNPTNYYTKTEVDERDLWVSGTGLNSVVLKGSSGTASGGYAVAEGYQTSASGHGSHAEGWATITNNTSEHASGQFNVSSKGEEMLFGSSGSTLFSVGNGTADDNRHNAFEIRQNGDIYIVRSGNTVLLQDEIGNITIDQVMNSGTSASTNAVSTKAVYDYVTENELVVSRALNDLETRKLDASAYTPTDLSDYYTKSETSGKTEISNALQGKVNSATFTAHTADTTIHLTSGDVKTQIDDRLGSGFTGANSANTVTSVIESNERVVSSSLNDLNSRKADTSAVTNAISDALSTLTIASSAVTSMASYATAASGTSITTSDTLNQAIGKLEKRIQLLEAAMGGLKLVQISQTDYDNLQTKDSNTLYVIV